MATNGYLGRFSERLKKMRINRLKKKKGDILIEDSDKIYTNFVKVMAAIPLMVYDNVFDKNTSINKNIGDKNKDEKSINSNLLVDKNVKYNNIDNYRIDNYNDKSDNRNSVRNKKREIINSIDIASIKKKQNNYNITKNNNNDNVKIDNVNKEHELSNVDTKLLEKKIINLIKKDLIKMVNELEILESELYILSEVNGDEKTLIECKRNIDEVKKILCKIDILKNKYDFLRDNYDFEYLLEIDNNELVDSIIMLKNMFDNNQVRGMVEDYKLLDMYKYLYIRIDQIHEETEKFELDKEKKILELKERDIDFDHLKNNVNNLDRVNESYDYFVKEQNEFLKELDKNVSKINSYEIINYRLNGFGKYLFNSFKYLGLMMMSPLRGVVPSIATQTLVTKNIVSNLYKNLNWEEDRRLVYEAIDYSSVISNAIIDLDHTSEIVDMTLEDIVKLKIEYNEKFKMYQGDFSEYEDVIRKINDMENKIMGNKIKIEIMKNRMKQKERENENTLKRVKKLNDTEEKNIQ